MSDKLDPNLRAILDAPGADTAGEVALLLGLAHPADEDVLAALRASGLNVRSVIGDVLTGAAAVSRIPAIAAHPSVLKIEAAGPLYPETPVAPPTG